MTEKISNQNKKKKKGLIVKMAEPDLLIPDKNTNKKKYLSLSVFGIVK